MIDLKNSIRLGVAVMLSALFIACNSSASNSDTRFDSVVQTNMIEQELTADNANSEQSKNDGNKPISITSEQYIQLVADFKKDKEWKFKGKKPCVVDFYADWCRPCKMMEPAFEKAAEKYAGKVNFYKINVDFNKDISAAYQITGIPTLFFCTVDGKVGRVSGLLSEEEIMAYVESILAK